MKPENKKILHRAIATFGRSNQKMQTLEELMELQRAIFENVHRGTDNKKEIIEEVADVEIMLAQVKMIYDIDQKEIEKIQDYKVGRLDHTIDKYLAKQAANNEQVEKQTPDFTALIDRETSNGR
jgi:hypothetical protein